MVQHLADSNITCRELKEEVAGLKVRLKTKDTNRNALLQSLEEKIVRQARGLREHDESAGKKNAAIEDLEETVGFFAQENTALGEYAFACDATIATRNLSYQEIEEKLENEVVARTELQESHFSIMQTVALAYFFGMLLLWFC